MRLVGAVEAARGAPARRAACAVERVGAIVLAIGAAGRVPQLALQSFPDPDVVDVPDDRRSAITCSSTS